MKYIQAFGWTNNVDIKSQHIIFIHGKDLPQFLSTHQFNKIITISETADIVIQNIVIPSWIYKIYSTNLNVMPSEQCCAIPYGILLPQAQLMQKIDKEKTYFKKHLLYMNFATWTHPSRPQIYNSLKHKHFIYDRVNNELHKQNTDEAYFIYYNDIIESKFVLCPRGNGIDTYRMWEVLYLGSIPVVEKSLFTAHFRNKLPILEIENWNDISEGFLEEQYKIIKSKQWNIELLDRQYWIQKWINDIRLLENNSNTSIRSANEN